MQVPRAGQGGQGPAQGGQGVGARFRLQGGGQGEGPRFRCIEGLLQLGEPLPQQPQLAQQQEAVGVAGFQWFPLQPRQGEAAVVVFRAAQPQFQP